MAHTPGPWRVENDTTLIWGNCDPDDVTSYGMGYPVANVEQPRAWRRQYPSNDEIDGNCLLIAAAPDLLDALEKLPLPSTMGTPAQHYTRFYDWYQGVAIPAIRKAGGLA